MGKPVFEDLFRFSGRRNRRSYFLFLLVALLLADVLARVTVALLVIGVSLVAVTTQRCRDCGWSGWAVLVLAIPLINFVFGVALLLAPGDRGDNRYGPDPLRKDDP